MCLGVIGQRARRAHVTLLSPSSPKITAVAGMRSSFSSFASCPPNTAPHILCIGLGALTLIEIDEDHNHVRLLEVYRALFFGPVGSTVSCLRAWK